MSYATINIADWAVENFGSCQLGDARRTRRAVQIAQQMAEYPDGSTPDQFERWADLKGAYRLFDSEQATFAAIAEPHWRQTCAKASGTVLVIGDTMETNFGWRREIAGLGPTGNGSGRGFLLHSSLMVDASSREIIGLAGQELFYRRQIPDNDNSYQVTQRPRESQVWGRVIDLVGQPAEETQYIHVFDRGADNLEVFCHLIQQRSDWVIRAAQLHRSVWDSEGAKRSLRGLLADQPLLGTYELAVRGRWQTPARTAQLEVRAAQSTIKRPKRMTPYLKHVQFEELTQWVVDVREVDAPSGVEPLRWVLWTSLPVTSLESAWQVIEHYEQRWLVEEFHKAIKTGCRLESRQYEAARRLEVVTGFMSVLAVRLVQLKTLARAQPNMPAEEAVPKLWLEMLRALRRRPQIYTIREFFRHLAGLGGFLLRKRDGEPGWITIWRGTDKLIIALRGHQAMRRRSG